MISTCWIPLRVPSGPLRVPFGAISPARFVLGT